MANDRLELVCIECKESLVIARNQGTDCRWMPSRESPDVGLRQLIAEFIAAHADDCGGGWAPAVIDFEFESQRGRP